MYLCIVIQKNQKDEKQKPFYSVRHIIGIVWLQTEFL